MYSPFITRTYNRSCGHPESWNFMKGGDYTKDQVEFFQSTPCRHCFEKLPDAEQRRVVTGARKSRAEGRRTPLEMARELADIFGKVKPDDKRLRKAVAAIERYQAGEIDSDQLFGFALPCIKAAYNGNGGEFGPAHSQTIRKAGEAVFHALRYETLYEMSYTDDDTWKLVYDSYTDAMAAYDKECPGGVPNPRIFAPARKVARTFVY